MRNSLKCKCCNFQNDKAGAGTSTAGVNEGVEVAVVRMKAKLESYEGATRCALLLKHRL